LVFWPEESGGSFEFEFEFGSPDGGRLSTETDFPQAFRRNRVSSNEKKEKVFEVCRSIL
jgi:hypothetical protein